MKIKRFKGQDCVKILTTMNSDVRSEQLSNEAVSHLGNLRRIRIVVERCF